MAQKPFDHQPLFNQRVVLRSVSEEAVSDTQARLLAEWAKAIRDGSIRSRGERQLRGSFVQRFFVDLLGYQTFASGTEFTLTDEARAGAGSADLALGRFGSSGDEVIAPVELKGPDTGNLDVTMPGRNKSPVQQVWEYAMDLPYVKFLVLTNMLELRLYAVGYTRRAYERFDLLEVADDPREFRKLRLLLGAENLLTGRTAQLLEASAKAEREITHQLYADYKRWRIQLIVALAQDNDMAPGDLIAPAQKLLDRVLFVAFAQQRGLLPSGTLQEVHSTHNHWAPHPRYENYKGLFAAVDRGLPARGIPPYNGGLFAHDALLDDRLAVPDATCDLFSEFAKYDFGGEVSVNVLGHIFEQSISDIEELQSLAAIGAFTLEAAQAQAQSASRVLSGARKEQGIVYTPEFVTSFIVDQTLGRTLEEHRRVCASRYQIADGSDSTKRAWRAPTPEETKYKKKAKLREPERVVELGFWRDWQTELTAIKVCDPACGSGAFLVAAFDVLLAEYTDVNEQIAAITGSLDVFNADKEILNSNLFGVDLNAESIEITKLSLWLKTARHGKPLESLEANLRVGNSLISSADGGLEYDQRAFDWVSAFPDVVAWGGFDVVIGNPPYVRMERLKAIKPYLESRYDVASDRADLYCYFFELAIRLLRNGTAGGRIGFISSSTFFKTESGEPLRRYLLANAQIEAVVDFGDLQVFEGVTTYPTIVVARRSGNPSSDLPLRFMNVKADLPQDFAKAFKVATDSMPQGRLSAASWQFESDALSRLRRKLLEGHLSLREVYGSPLYGIKTGLNDAFVIDRDTRDRFIAQDPQSAEILKPFLEGKDLKKWHTTSRDLWLIYIPRNRIEIDEHPSIRAHLLTYRAELEKRATKQEWFELQQAQEAYGPQMAAPKLIYTRFMNAAMFCLDARGSYYLNNALNFIGGVGAYEVGLLNSRVAWFAIKELATLLSGGFVQVHGHVLEKCPIPSATDADRDSIAVLASTAQSASEARRDEIRRFGHMVLRDLAPSGVVGASKLSERLGENNLSFANFTQELKHRFKRDLSLSERNDWESALADSQDRVAEQEVRIAQCEREIDEIVQRLFDLSPEEIELIQ